MTRNPVIDNLPKHLKAFIIPQNYKRYTPQDQAVWRYVMRQNVQYLGKVAHEAYLTGLKKTGISIERIPSLEEMNEILARIGWAAATVDGFIPPAAFMEFQKYKVLVIAADIRTLNQIEYTPAPDIIHEAAGHAPIIADPEYAEYLRYFGEIGCRAFSSKKDHEIYEEIRHLSILKAYPYTPEEEIKKAEEKLEKISAENNLPSEMSLIRNLHWWTVEYGLIGDLKNPKIYGAGLLSSIGESKGALKDKVIKLPYTLDAKDYNFDITKQQPQLFVTPDFNHLTQVLDEFANQMAIRIGGVESLMKAIESQNTATAEYSSGLQVSGVFSEVITDHGHIVYLKTNSPTTLNRGEKILKGHSKKYHQDGFGSPVGKIQGALKPMRLLTDQDLENLHIEKGKKSAFEFESGLKVNGILRKITRQEGDLVLLTFSDCIVTYKGKTLFEPSWGMYDMAIGEQIVSVFNGPVDPEAYGLSYAAPEEKTVKINYSKKEKALHQLYQETRHIRETKQNMEMIPSIWEKILNSYPDNWLIAVELFELVKKLNVNSGIKEKITSHLDDIAKKKPEISHLIYNGKLMIES